MDIVFAKDTVVLAGGTVVAGTHWPADDPLVKAYPSLFTADVTFGLCSSTPRQAPAPKPPVEQATAAPGEKRASRRAG